MNTPPRALESRYEEEGRLFSPSSQRNKAFIAETFSALGLTSGSVLEIGCGTGEHSAELLRRFPGMNWFATDIDEVSVRSAKAWAQHFGLSDRLDGRVLDVLSEDFETFSGAFDLIYSANVIHISPIDVMKGIVSKAGQLLKSGGVLVFYGPFRRDGRLSPQSNVDFDVSLKSRNPEWGIRDLEDDVCPEAESAGLQLKSVLEMPANNFLVCFEKKNP